MHAALIMAENAKRTRSGREAGVQTEGERIVEFVPQPGPYIADPSHNISGGSNDGHWGRPRTVVSVAHATAASLGTGVFGTMGNISLAFPRSDVSADSLKYRSIGGGSLYPVVPHALWEMEFTLSPKVVLDGPTLTIETQAIYINNNVSQPRLSLPPRILVYCLRLRPTRSITGGKGGNMRAWMNGNGNNYGNEHANTTLHDHANRILRPLPGHQLAIYNDNMTTQTELCGS
ncbi:hypothetical protein BJ322DRAFT_1020459 [Thelephora terrestris]|uniref:Uncharacterized protein n=1 Tax=Thelephora terrestris TaxID=56493 RepID=A0A9P6L7A9_9AGAM|nr:hypothetical protein BJ322DRAFT_1020459 [Thelephora terrestris]